MFTNSPEELQEEDFDARLKKTMYGTQGAAQKWDEAWVKQVEKLCVKAGIANRALF